MDVKESLDFQSIEAIKQCVKSGFRNFDGTLLFSKGRIRSNKLIGEEIAPEHPAIATFLAYQKDKWLSPSMNSMISLIRSHAENWT